MPPPPPSTKSTTGARKKACVKLDMSLFDPASLRDEVVFENAIAILEGYLANPEFGREELLLLLSEYPNLLALILSSLSSTQFNHLREDVFKSFPTTAGSFAGSISATLLTVLTHVFGSLAHPASNLDVCQRAVELAPPVLDALAILCAVEDIADDALEASRVPGKRRMTQSWAKKVKRANQMPYVDAAVFDRLAEAVPTSKVEAMELASKILSDQKNTLNYYFDVLRKPELSAMFKNAYVPAEIPGDVLIPNPSQSETLSQEPILPELFANTQAHNTYTTFEPLTANLFFGSAEGFGDWRIIIAQKASKDLRDACKKNPPLYDTIIKKLLELSHGYFSGDNQKRLAGPDNGIPIFEAKMLGDSRLVYRIDCVQEYGSEVETQALRVYGIYTHAKMRGDRFWDAVSRTVGAGREYRSRCLYRTASTGSHQDVTYPASWPPLEEKQANEEFIFQDLSIEDKQELRSLVVMEHFVPVSQALMNSINENYDITHPFYISPEEQAIVQYNGSSFVLGRSGTGKTTAIVYKMVGLERSWMLRHEDVRQTTTRPRQVFVTQSRVLAEKVEDYFHSMFSTVKAEGYDIQESSKMAAIRTKNRELTMVDKDEEGLHRKDLPKRWSELTDDHFPLFVTSDHLWRLLEADFAELQDKDETNSKTNSRRASKSQILQTRPNFVSYNQFLNMYWAHFPQDLVKGVVPSAAFAEFMGVIKGSEKTLRSEKGYLDKGTYCQEILGTSSFSGRREAMYALFEAYTKMRKRLGQYDAADRTHAIIRNLMQHGVPGEKVHYVFVDEAQDNLLIDSLILRYLCLRPDGLLWAGDTAQTISAGSTFRFQELTALMHRVEQGTKRHRPQFFQLTKNYRSHGGIVRCAQTIVELLSKLWPHQIDILAEEEGVIDGPLPIYFSGGEQHAPRFEQFLSDESGRPLAFGAEQCILVRDEEAKTRLRAELGEVGIIMTLLDSKGLEFDDILLYNFFADSSLTPSQWRVVLNGLSDGRNTNCPTFNEEKHHGICGELKRLYVGVTRARMNLWFFDYSDTGEPMRILWDSRSQVTTWSPGMPVPRLVKISSREKWAKKADQLFDNKNWSEAQLAYRRAQMPREEKIAEAYYLRDVADKEPSNSRAERTRKKSAFIHAATAFEAAAAQESSAVQRQSYFRIAAECYAVVDDHQHAAVLYEQANEYQASTLHYRWAGLFDDAVRVIKTHDDKINNPSLVGEILDVSKLFYFTNGHIEKAKELFESAEDAVDFTDIYGLDDIRATLLEDSFDYAQAAELRYQEGDIDKAVQLLLLSDSSAEGMQRACQRILEKLWNTCSLGISRDDRLICELEVLLVPLEHITIECLTQIQKDELSVFKAIHKGDSAALLRLSRHTSNSAILALCLDQVFSDLFCPAQISADNLAEHLQLFLRYCRHLQQLLRLPDASESPEAQKLLAFSPVAGRTDLYLAQPNTLLGRMACGPTSDQAFNEQDHGETLHIPKGRLRLLVMKVLNTHLLRRVAAQNSTCREVQAFKMCEPFLIDGNCRFMDGCREMHFSSIDTHQYEQLVTNLLVQIQVYQTIDGIEDWAHSQEQRRYWISLLYGAMHPASPRLGGVHLLASLKLPKEGFRVIGHWLCEGMFMLRPDKRFVVTQILRYPLMNKALHGSYIPDYVFRVPRVLYSYQDPSWLKREGEANSIVADMLQFLGRGPSSLSSAILMIRHILKEKLPIDLRVLCDILDILCAALILALRNQTGSLNGIVLPYSWLARAMERLPDHPYGNTELVSHYIEPLSELLELLYPRRLSDEDGWSTRFGRHNKDYTLRSIFMARICQNLCLFGYNIRDYLLREEVLDCLKSLNRSNENRLFHPVYGRFVTISHWGDVARSVRSETFRPALDDEMVEIIHSTKLAEAWPLANPNMRRLVYTSVSDLPRLLHGRVYQSHHPATHPRRAGADQHAAFATVPGMEGGRMPVTDAEGFDEEADTIQRRDINSVRFGDTHAPNRQEALSDQDIEKIRVVQRLYRRNHKRPSDRWLWVDTKFRLCLDLVRSNEISARRPHRHYRMHILGPLPHLLAGLEGMGQYLHSGKSAAKQKLLGSKEGHLQLERIREHMTNLSELAKKTTQLEKELDPGANTRQYADIARLKELAKEAYEVVSSLPRHETIGAWAEHLHIAYKGIVVVPKPQKKKSLPALNTDDLDEYDPSF